MRIITIDFETYFDKEYTLQGSKALTTEEYVRDARFEAHGAAVHEEMEGKFCSWMRPDELKEYLEALDQSRRTTGRPIFMLAHHAHFDGLILSHHFDFRPDYWLDTLSMARVCFTSSQRLRLDALAQLLELPEKNVPYNIFKGKHWDELTEHEQYLVSEGCCHDCVLTRTLFDLMMQGYLPQIPYAFPRGDLPVIDLTIKMFTEPTLRGDINLLAKAWTVEDETTKALYTFLDVTPKELRKDEVFADLLRQAGIEPDRKVTAKGNEKYAFAKSDFFMQDLENDESEDVRRLVEARLRAHSSIYRTRTERLGWMATRGLMPVYLSYAAAHTRRWGGGDKVNWQNFPRSDPVRPEKGALRRAIKI